MAYYIDTNDFTTATAVWTNSILTTKATDGYYSFGGNYRQQISGLLTDLISCPNIDTVSITAIEETTATFNGNLISNGGDISATRGFVYGTSPNPTTANNVLTDTAVGQGAYSLNATGLTSGTVYYVKAYAIVFGSTIYGDELNFETQTVVSYPIDLCYDLNSSALACDCNEAVVLNPFDYIIVTYEYVPPIGLDYDLDTLTTFRYTDSIITGNTSSTIAGFIPGTGVVGCGTAAATPNSTIPTGRAIDNSYLTFGGDDNNQKVDGAYGESVVINFKILEDSGILDPTKNIIIAELFAGWHFQEGGYTDYPINIKYETYIGGNITNYILPPIPPGTQTNRYISNGTRPDPEAISNPITAAQSGCSNGVTGLYAKRKMASISYNRTTQEAFIIFL